MPLITSRHPSTVSHHPGRNLSMADDERDALRTIEQNLIRTDPGFAARMRSPQAAAPRFPWIFALCAFCYVVIPIEALLSGWRSAVLTLDLIAAAMAIIMIRRSRNRGA
jgi:hypothetical protein